MKLFNLIFLPIVIPPAKITPIPAANIQSRVSPPKSTQNKATVNTDTIIIGAIMPMVPGVAITNAIRDTLQGDYILAAR